MKRTLKKLLSLVLAAALFVGAVPMQAFAAEKTEVYLPELELGEDILAQDVFYLATRSAAIPENGDGAYLLRVGRGGPSDSEAGVLVKIADMTAKYGEDYVVRVRSERTKVENPEDNFSLMEMMQGADFEQRSISDPEAIADRIDSDPEAQEAYREGVNAALDFLEEASGLKDKYGDEDPYAQTADALEAEIEAVPADGSGEVVAIGGGEGADAGADPVQAAANLFTGQNATAQRLTNEGDMFQDLQAIANVMTNAVVGASVELTFRPGETE